MKKTITALLISVFVFLAVSCDFKAGEDGKAYMTVKSDGYADATYCYSNGFPDDWSYETAFEIQPGTYDIEYAQAKQIYDSADSMYKCYINSWDSHYENASEMNVLDQLVYYFTEDTRTGAGMVFVGDLTISINEGKKAETFADGDDGADKDYTITLAWNPNDTVISHADRSLTRNVLPDNGGVQFKDDTYTFTLTTSEKAAASAPSIEKGVFQ